MNKEFHYYVNYLVALAAGFTAEESYKVAYSAQFVDDNIKEINIHYNGNFFTSTPTQSYDLSSPKSERIWKALHFIPNTKPKKSPRKDGIQDRNIVQKNCPLAQYLMKFAISQQSLFLLGIASHAYADTWAHQNFVGGFSYLNLVNHHNRFILNYFGHTDALTMPDIMNLVWRDSRLKVEMVHNKKKFLEAAEKLYHYYCKRTKKAALSVKILLEELSFAIGEEVYNSFEANWTQRVRIRNYQRFSMRYFAHRIPAYCAKNWLSAATKLRFGKYIARNNFKKSEYYLFQKAAEKALRYMHTLLHMKT